MRFILAIALVAALVPLSLSAERPNVVIFLCDELGYGDMKCIGHPDVQSPNLDRLASEGLRLTSCYSASPVCSPSRAGLMTGRTPNRLGIRDWIPAQSGVFLRPDEVTIAHLLKKAGYQTCHVGKWHLNSRINGSEPTPGDAGFDHWLYTQNNAGPSHLNPVNFVRNGERVGRLEGPSSHVIVAEAMRWLDDRSGAPFYLNVWFHEPHEPVAAADEFLALYPDEENLDRRHWLGDISQMDAAVGKLLKYLDEHGLTENTLVLFTSDNGPETLSRYPKANRSHGSPGPLRGMKLHMTEGGYRVPGILRWPGHTMPGSVSDEPVCSVDLLPTLCEIAGVEAPADRALDGASFLPMLEGKPIPRQQPLYWQYDIAISHPFMISLRDGDWKLLANSALDRLELFNLADDLREARDRAADQPDRVRSMLEAMKSRQAEVAADGEDSGNPPQKK
jgi:arylsulfatase A